MDDAGAGPAEWHREVVETAPVPVAVYDRDGRLEYANEATLDFVNAEDRSVVEGRPALEFVADDSRETAADRVERVLNEREPLEPVEHTFEAVDGETKHAIVASAPIVYDGGAAGQVILNDITERRRHEDELRRQRDRFETLFEHLPTPAAVGEARDGEPVILRVNEQFEDVFGYSTAEIRGRRLSECIVPDDERARMTHVSERLLAEDVVEAEVRRTAVDGPRDFLLRAVTYDRGRGPPRGYAIYVDITERKESQEKLERRNERLNELASLIAHDLRNPLTVAEGYLDLARQGEGDLERVSRAHDRLGEIIDDLLALARYGDDVTDLEPLDLEATARRAWSMCDTVDSELVVEASTTIEADDTRLCQLFENLIRNAIEHNDAPVTVRVGPIDDGNGFYLADDGCGIPPTDRNRIVDPGYSTADEGTGYGLTIVNWLAQAHDWTLAVVESEDGGARFEVSGVGGAAGD